MRDDYAIAADLCEEHGLVEPARVLREIAGRTCEVFMVKLDWFPVEHGELSGPIVEAALRTRVLFWTRTAAGRHAAHLKAAFFRESCYPVLNRRVLFTVPEAEFCRLVGSILKTNYLLPDAPLAPLIPAWAGDEQLAAIAPLLNLEMFEVVSVPFIPAMES